MAKKRIETLLIQNLYCFSIKFSIAFYTRILRFNIQHERADVGVWVFPIQTLYRYTYPKDELREDDKKLFGNICSLKY